MVIGYLLPQGSASAVIQPFILFGGFMQFWQRSIQWQLILSMGSALVVSILTVVGIYTVVVNRLAQSYLLEQALPSSIEAMRNDIERILVQPLAAVRDIATNTLVLDWLADDENSAQTSGVISYLSDVRAEHKAFTALISASATNHYYTEKGLERTLNRNRWALVSHVSMASSERWLCV